MGATLYYLLTGRAPFEDENILKLATRIAVEQPPPLHSLRPDIPRGLSRVVTRCLAKRPANRFETHGALAAELEPFSSRAPVPAGAGLRAAAGLLDWFALGVLLTPLALYFQWVAPEASTGPVRLAMYLVVGALYFGILESRSASSVGKWLCGLRVVDSNGEKVAPWRGLARGALFVLGLQSVNVQGAAGLIDVEPAPGIQFYPPLYFSLLIKAGFEASAGVNFQWFAGIALLFLTARRSNGLAGLHELGTRTRVVMRRTTDASSTVAMAGALTPPTTSSTSVGPYEVLEPIGDDLLLGYDGRLRRRVWIRLLPPGTRDLPPRRRDLSRSARLRWLNGRRTADECWDVYEAADGAPLVQLLGGPHPWSAASRWLRDLTLELTSGLHDQSLPDLDLDRVWITPDGRAKLLDWPVRPANGSVEPTRLIAGATADLESVQDFLRSVALSALAGRVVSHQAALRELSLQPLPLWARSLLQRLEQHGFESPEELAEATALVDRRPACVTARQRLLHLAASSVVPVIVAMCLVPGLSMILVWGPQHPESVELTECLTELNQLEQLRSAERGSRAERLQELGYAEGDLDKAIQALEVYVAGRHRVSAADASTWSQPFVSADQRGVAEGILATHPSPSDAEVIAARGTLAPFFKRLAGFHPEFREPLSTRTHMVLTVPLAFVPWVAALSLISAALFRGGLLLRGLGVVVVARSGAEASRLRSFVRAVVGWAPALLLGFLVYVDGEPNPSASVLEWISVPALVAYAVSTTALLAGIAWMVREPARGLQDRVAGTYLVPR